MTRIQNKQIHRKRDQTCGYQRQRVGMGKLDEGGQKLPTSGYKISTRTIIYNMIIKADTVV